MKDFKSLSHTKWDYKYHIVFIPKYRKKVLYGNIQKYLGEFLPELAKHKESKIVEGHICVDHVHFCISISPKYAVLNVMGYIKGKSAISIVRNILGLKRNFTGQKFWARGYLVSTVGLDENTIRSYIKNQEKSDRDKDQLSIFDQLEQ